MQNLVDELITYLDGKFLADTYLPNSNKPKGHYAYEKDLIPDATTLFYTVELLDDSSFTEDFNAELTSSCSVQINLYGVKARINGAIKDAQKVSFYLADKCKEFMNEYKYTNNMVVSMRRVGAVPSFPYEDGSKSYYATIRYNIIRKEI